MGPKKNPKTPQIAAERPRPRATRAVTAANTTARARSSYELRNMRFSSPYTAQHLPRVARTALLTVARSDVHGRDLAVLLAASEDDNTAQVRRFDTHQCQQPSTRGTARWLLADGCPVRVHTHNVRYAVHGQRLSPHGAIAERACFKERHFSSARSQESTIMAADNLTVMDGCDVTR